MFVGRNVDIYKPFVAVMTDSCTHAHRYTSIVRNLLVRMNTPYSRLGNLGAFAVYREGARRERDSFCTPLGLFRTIHATLL